MSYVHLALKFYEVKLANASLREENSSAARNLPYG